jgi:hypothetical protein
MTDKILPKEIVHKWLLEVMEHQYDITIHPRESIFGERFLRRLQQQGFEYREDQSGKVVVSFNDPIKLANLAMSLKKQGYLIED